MSKEAQGPLALYDRNIKAKAILFDATKCTACRGCQVACKQWHDLPAEKTKNYGSYQNPPDLTPQTWLVIRFDETKDEHGLPRWLFNRQSCFHCLDPDCVRVCPPEALKRRNDGVVDITPDLCIGCGYCIDACPFGVPKMDPASKRVYKCNFCVDRLDYGLPPACVSSCPTGALEYGERADLLARARARVEQLRTQGFEQADIYGAKRYQTGVLLILPFSPGNYSWLPARPEGNRPIRWWKGVFNPLGSLVMGGTAAAAIIHYVVVGPHRIRKEKNKDSQPKGG